MSSTQTQIDQTDSTETTADTTEEIDVIEMDAVVGDDTDEEDTYPVRKAGETFDGPQNIRNANRRARPYEDETATCNYCGADVDGEDLDSIHAANDDANAHTSRAVSVHCSSYNISRGNMELRAGGGDE